MLFGPKKNRELEVCLARTHSNMSNNYKDAAQEGFKEAEAVFSRLQSEGKLSDKQVAYYKEIVENLRQQLVGYTHKDQNARWMG